MVEIDDLLKRPVQYQSGVPILTRAEIEHISENILSKHMPGALINQKPVDIEELVENKANLQVDYQLLCPDGSILGETIFVDGCREVYGIDDASGFTKKQYISVKKGTIILDSNMVDQETCRTNFTEAHEFGHWTLHRLFYGSNEKRACRSHRKQVLYFPHREVMTPIQWTEWQANTFAAALLLPRPALRTTLQTFLKANGLTWNKLKDFSLYENRVEYDKFLYFVAKTYEVSKETARLRMNKLCRIKYPH